MCQIALETMRPFFPVRFRIMLPLVLLLGLVACPARESVGTESGVKATTGEAIISSFTATPDTLPVGGGSLKLEWNVSGADTISIDQIGVVTGNSVDVTVSASKAFTLTATNTTAGSVTSVVAVLVGPGTKSVDGQVSSWTRGPRTIKAVTSTIPAVTLATGVLNADGTFSTTLSDPRAVGHKLGSAFPPASGCNNPQYSVTSSSVKGIAASFEVFNTNGLKTGTLLLGSSLQAFSQIPTPGEVQAFYYFVDQNVQVNGPCNNVSFDLNLKAGWNILWLEGKATDRIDIRSAALPSNIKWLLQLQPSRITINNAVSNLRVGETVTLSASAYDEADALISEPVFVWSVSNANIASITQAGVVTAKGNGQFSVNVSSGGKTVSTASITVRGLEARGGTFNSGLGSLGTAFLLRDLGANNQGPANDVNLTIRGPATWNGGQPYTLTYPKGKDHEWTLLENIAPVSGSYTATGSTGTSQFVIDAQSKLEPVSDILPDYSTGYVSASWTLPKIADSTVSHARLIDQTTATTLAEQQSSWRASTFASWSFQKPLEISHGYELHVALLSADVNAYSNLPTQFNVSKTVKVFDFTPQIKSLSVNGGPSDGNLRLVIKGKHFVNGALLKIGGVNSSSVSVDNSEQITAIVPAGVVGTTDVTVTTSVGTSPKHAETKFSYFALTEYRVSGFSKLLAGANGVIWFLPNEGTQALGKIQNGQITYYNMPQGWSSTFIIDFTIGPDGQVWLVQQAGFPSGYANNSGMLKFNPSTGTFGTPFRAPLLVGNTNLNPNEVSMIVTGPDQNIWITYDNINYIAKLKPSDGSLIEAYLLPITEGVSSLGEMIVGPDNAIWFPARYNRVGKVTSTGEITFFNSGGNTSGITNGPDGNVWMGGGVTVLRCTPAGVFSQFQLKSTNYPNFEALTGQRLVKGGDNKFWFGFSYLGRMDTSGNTINIGLYDPTKYDDRIRDMVADSTGKVWYSRYGKIGVITPY